jgi:adenine nucleotide transporter 17
MKIFKEEGVKGFYSGLTLALLLVSNPIIQYTVYEKLKEKLEKARSTALTSMDFFVLGAISKLCATGLTYPSIVLKSRMQYCV